MTIEQQIEQNIPPKKRKSKNNYNYIRNNEVEWNGNGRRREIMIVIKVDTLEELKAMQQMLDFANKNSVEYGEFLHDENTMVEFGRSSGENSFKPFTSPSKV